MSDVDRRHEAMVRAELEAAEARLADVVAELALLDERRQLLTDRKTRFEAEVAGWASRLGDD